MKTTQLIAFSAILGLLSACGGSNTGVTTPGAASVSSEDCPKKQINTVHYDRAVGAKGEASPEEAISATSAEIASKSDVKKELTSKIKVADDHTRFVYFNLEKKAVAQLDVKKNEKGEWYVQGGSFC